MTEAEKALLEAAVRGAQCLADRMRVLRERADPQLLAKAKLAYQEYLEKKRAFDVLMASLPVELADDVYMNLAFEEPT